MPTLQIIRGDITRLEVDAVVNAANAQLTGGGGVDGAIHYAAGKAQLLAATAQFGRCNTGDAVATPGFNLPARWIFHTVGPVWSIARSEAQGQGEQARARLDALLARCYRRCLELAREHSVKSIAFPAISTGVYSFPPDRAATIAIRTVREELDGSGVETVIFCCFNRQTEKIYLNLLGGVNP